jgi:hypothetical protein
MRRLRSRMAFEVMGRTYDISIHNNDKKFRKININFANVDKINPEIMFESFYKNFTVEISDTYQKILRYYCDERRSSTTTEEFSSLINHIVEQVSNKVLLHKIEKMGL